LDGLGRLKSLVRTPWWNKKWIRPEMINLRKLKLHIAKSKVL
jgi:hypothetical protein